MAMCHFHISSMCWGKCLVPSKWTEDLRFARIRSVAVSLLFATCSCCRQAGRIPPVCWLWHLCKTRWLLGRSCWRRVCWGGRQGLLLGIPLLGWAQGRQDLPRARLAIPPRPRGFMSFSPLLHPCHLSVLGIQKDSFIQALGVFSSFLHIVKNTCFLTGLLKVCLAEGYTSRDLTKRQNLHKSQASIDAFILFLRDIKANVVPFVFKTLFHVCREVQRRETEMSRTDC